MRKLVLYIPSLEVKVLTEEGIWEIHPEINGSFVPNKEDYVVLDERIQERFYGNWEKYDLDFLFPDLCVRFNQLMKIKNRSFHGKTLVKSGGSWYRDNWEVVYKETPEYKSYCEHREKCYRRYVSIFKNNSKTILTNKI